jgi:shikimate dehydrogenase
MPGEYARERSGAEQGPTSADPAAASSPHPVGVTQEPQPPREIGGPKGLEPTRYGDWERAGRCIDF